VIEVLKERCGASFAVFGASMEGFFITIRALHSYLRLCGPRAYMRRMCSVVSLACSVALLSVSRS
jgi:hypothetical protein